MTTTSHMNVLTENTIKTLYTCDKSHVPITQCNLQVINLKSMGPPSRYRVIVSDGAYCMQAILSTNHASLVESGGLPKYSVISATEFTPTDINNRRFLLLFKFEVLSDYPLARIGNPVNMENTRLVGRLTCSSVEQSQTTSPQPLMHLLQQREPQSQQPFHPFVRPIQQPHPPQQPQPRFLMPNSGDSSSLYDSSTPRPEPPPVVTIHRLNPYQSRWTIKARVIQKSEIKTWSNPRTEGKLFSVHLLDSTGEIKATAFQREVDRLYQVLAEGQVYTISNARVVVAKKQFSTLDNEYELMLEHCTEVETCADDLSLPSANYSFTKIADIDKKQKNDIVDVLGVVVKDCGISEYIGRSNSIPGKKRDLCIVDETLKEIRVTIWGRIAELFDSSDFPVVAFKGLKVNDYGGYTLSLQISGDIKRNPSIPEALKLQSWYRTQGQQVTYTSFTNMMTTSDSAQIITNTPKMTIADAKNKYHLGEHQTADLFAVRGTVMYIKTESYCYPACPQCRKKLASGENSFRCEKCLLDVDTPDYRYLLGFSIQDDTAQLYVMAFHEAAEKLLQKSVTQMRETYGSEHFQMVAFDPPINRTYNFTIKAQQDVYNDVARTRYVVLEATPVDFIVEGQNLVTAIDLLMA